jgi:hypothetical protein
MGGKPDRTSFCAKTPMLSMVPSEVSREKSHTPTRKDADHTENDRVIEESQTRYFFQYEHQANSKENGCPKRYMLE